MPLRLFYAAWSVARGPQPIGRTVARTFEIGVVLAIGLLFPSSPGARVTAGWKIPPASMPSLSQSQSRSIRGTDR